MLPFLSAAIVLCPLAPHASHALTSTPSASATAIDDKAVRALDAWLKLYRSGKIDFLSKDPIGKDSIAIKFGVAPKNGLGHPTWAGDLAEILDAVVKLDDEAAAQALLEVAAVGIDQGKYEFHMAPYAVREAGENAAAKLTSAPAKEHLAKAARGELKSERAMAVALQTAGVRCLGRLRDPAHRAALEAALGDGDEIVRVSAAEALGSLGDEDGAPALAALLEREQVDAVLVATAQSLQTLYAKYLPKPGSSTIEPSPDRVKQPEDAGATEPASTPAEPPTPAGVTTPAAAPAVAPAPAAAPRAELPESVRLAVRGAIRALGRTTWRADMALIRFLGDFRSLDTVPALIGVLERFKASPDDVKSGKASGLVLYQAHELLVGMTGAVYPADQPEQWRAFWDAEKDKIVVTQKRDVGPAHTVASGFCGIPVVGTRVVFVLDLSGSMDFDMDDVGVDGKKRLTRRIDFAKRELCRAIDAISPNAQFNLITFNGNPNAEPWKKDLVQATPKNREAFKQHVNGLRAIGGTNLWSGLEDALKIRSLVYGNRYSTTIDELFVVSDGAPSVGDVQDPVEILRLVKECNKFANVRINTIYISSQTPAEHRRTEERMAIKPQELMRRMAEENGGKFREL
jgi:HEAT repeat protein/Mg-chelatase subunit ChlD